MRKLISLLVVLGMLFVAVNAFAWGEVNVEGQTQAWSSYATDTNPHNFAGGSSMGYGHYKFDGYFVGGGLAIADSTTKAWVGDGRNWRGAVAYTTSDSSALAGGLGYGQVDVSGSGTVEHGTRMGAHDFGTGGQTYGIASYGYDNGNSGCLLTYTSGSGTAVTGGYIERNNIPNGKTSHAVSGSFAIAN